MTDDCIFCGPNHPNGLRHSDAEIRAYERGRAGRSSDPEPAPDRDEWGALRNCVYPKCAIDRMALAQALLGSELIDRYREYAHKANPETLAMNTRHDLAQQWSNRIADWLEAHR